MKLNRRELLGLGAVVGAGTLVSGCSQVAKRLAAKLPDDISLPEGKMDPTVRLVNRVSFGPTPGEVARVQKMGRDAYLEEQLDPAGGEPLDLQMQVGDLDIFAFSPSELTDIPEEEIIRQLQQAALLRATYSPHQLQERMVEFWTNHFNIYARKGYAAYRKATDESDVVRKNALGKFPDLLRASAHSPAMLAYLDNQVNVRGVANENYARELMELHTLGVHGGYTQKDVAEVARCLTGWGMENRFMRPRGHFWFEAERHDDGEKHVLGHTIPAGGGEKDGDIVLDILANHPGTARFIAKKLCRHFLGDSGPALEDQVAAAYTATGGDIKAMLRPILTSRELVEGTPVAKRPFDFAVSALRCLNARSDCGKPLQRHLDAMGQPLYQWPMPDGYPERTSAWTSSLLSRWNFAIALTSGGIGRTTLDLDELDRKTHGATPAARFASLVLCRYDGPAVATLEKHGEDPAQLAALCLSAPEFQWR